MNPGVSDSYSLTVWNLFTQWLGVALAIMATKKVGSSRQLIMLNKFIIMKVWNKCEVEHAVGKFTERCVAANGNEKRVQGTN